MATATQTTTGAERAAKRLADKAEAVRAHASGYPHPAPWEQRQWLRRRDRKSAKAAATAERLAKIKARRVRKAKAA